MSDKKKKIDLVLLVFGAIAFFVIISVSIILYLLFSKYNKPSSLDNNSVNNYLSSQNTDVKPFSSPEELSSNYTKEVQKQIDFVSTSNQDISSVSKTLEDNLLIIRVPAENREKFLNVTLQIVRMQNQGLEIDPEASKNKILELLNSLLDYEKK